MNATEPHSVKRQELAPRVLAWESTRACNFACVHCRAKAQRKANPKQLTTQETLDMIDQIAAFCKPVFIISGGDPFLRADIFQVASHACSQGFRVVMSPSGSNITSKTFQEMKNAGVKMISLSLDGSTSKIHDNFRQVPGAFNMALENMALARESNFPFRVNTTVTQHNLGDLSNILKLATEIGAIEWDVFMLVPTGRGKVQMEITPQQYEETLQFIYTASLNAPIPIKMTCAPHYTRVTAEHRKKASQNADNSRPQTGGRGCMAGNGFCFISHIGEVFGCGFLPVAAGNIRQQSFRQIYQQSPLFIELRNHQLLKGKCGTCEYKVMCGGCRARALSINKNIQGEEPYCVYEPKRLGIV